jgi:hypothetical protein
MTILTLLNRIFNADQTPNNTVSWSGTNGLKNIQDDIAEEIRARGCIVVPTLTDLSAQGKTNSQTALVIGVGVYTWQPTGTNQGVKCVGASDGGHWFLQSNTLFVSDTTPAPTGCTGGVVLFSDGGVLKYVNPAGVTKTIQTI